MKKHFFSLIIGAALLASCSSTPKSIVTEYTSNVKGFLNAKTSEEGTPVFNVFTLTTVTDDWDGKEDFSTMTDGDKLVKVEFTAQSTDSQIELGMLETNVALYDASTKKTYAASVSLAAGPTFKGLASAFESGYAVFSVPADAKLDNLYLGTTNDANKDLGKAKTESLLPLKKTEAPKEKTITLNSKNTVVDNIFNLTKTYTLKSVTLNANDETVKKFRKESPESAAYSIVKLEIDIENSSASQDAWISVPWIVSEYKIGIPDYAFGETPSQIKPGKHSFTFYYKVFSGEKVLGFIGENLDAGDYTVKL
jgi:hypothetical protein